MQKRKKSLEIVDIVDENDKVIGQDTLQNAHNKGLWHRAVHVWVFNSNGELFIQQRNRKKMIVPLHWDSSAAEHSQSGESYEQAAVRGLKEELGIDADKLKLEKLVKKKSIYEVKGQYCNREFIQLFKCIYDGKINYDEGESETGKFFEMAEIKKLINGKSMLFVPIFVDFFNWYTNKEGN